MNVIEEFKIAGGHGGHVSLMAGEILRIVNTEGSQVVDVWAFEQSNPAEFLSTEHTRSCLQKLIPAQGDKIYTNLRRPMFSVVEDTSPGIHDMLLSACDDQRYSLLGHVGYHRNCADNLRDEMKRAGVFLPEIPSPFNVFENVSIGEKGELSIEAPVVKAGQSITMKAELDVFAVLSACPMDIAMTNGPDRRSKPIQVQRIK
jgi:uncharacterized protein YcgI (DUF1989 family)